MRLLSAPRKLVSSLAALAVALATGCGHHASEAECDEIVERIATLEFARQPGAARQSADDRRSEIDATKKSLRDTTLKGCIGRRVTDRAMRCVRQARSSQEIVDGCFD